MKNKTAKDTPTAGSFESLLVFELLRSRAEQSHCGVSGYHYTCFCICCFFSRVKSSSGQKASFCPVNMQHLVHSSLQAGCSLLGRGRTNANCYDQAFHLRNTEFEQKHLRRKQDSTWDKGRQTALLSTTAASIFSLWYLLLTQ